MLIVDMIIEQILAQLPLPVELQNILVMQSRHSSFIDADKMLKTSLGPRVSIHR